MYEDIQGVAIIGLSGRFPKAQSIEQYWENMLAGRDCTEALTREQIIESGVSPELADDPTYIRRSASLEGIDLFDADFFDYLPTEASITDPQIRLFLECVQHALDDAGCDPERYDGSIGVYAGVGLNNYLLKNLMHQPGSFENVLDFNKIISNDKDFLSTQVNYKFNLTGPGLTIQTACSTSLVAIQVAYQSLLTYQCDVALAGGAHIRSPRAKGMLYREGEIYAPDGLCRPFDKQASGTIFGEGAGVVVLKRVEDAIADRDHIYGVIRGAAINNDGSQKISYAAPSVRGQADVIAMAQALADVSAEDIGYVEAHGTGTKLGDPVEVRALTQAFRQTTDQKNYCSLGSGKSMIGHLDVAAGVAGFIRATLALKHKMIPATLHYNEPNPELKLSETPFQISAKAKAWDSNGKPRLAAVSSFGVGGTNAHAVLQEYPETVAAATKNEFHILTFSAKSQRALNEQCSQLAEYLQQHSNVSIADVCHTLQIGRRQFSHRKAIVCRSVEDAVTQLSANQMNTSIAGSLTSQNQPVFFMFSGQGSQHLNMCRDLYEHERVFKDCLDACAEAVNDILGGNLVDKIFGDESDPEKIKDIRQTCLAQPALYAIECGLAKLWAARGVKPQAMIGHSIGEFAAAHVSGVFSLADGARMVAMRGKLMQAMPVGAMLSLRNAAEDVEAVLEALGRAVSVVVINGPEMTVVGGDIDEINALKQELDAEEIPSTILHTSHAFHSPMMDDAVAPFVEELEKYEFKTPEIPFVSNVTGVWITPEQATDPHYWGKHLRSPVQFSAGIKTLCSKGGGVLLEVGPNQALNALCREQGDSIRQSVVIPSARHPRQDVNDAVYFYRAFGGLWANGVDVNPNQMYDGEDRAKVSLPGYPFQRQSYWREASFDRGELETANSDKSQVPIHDSLQDDTEQPASILTTVGQCWESVLGCSPSAEDNFFALGGHSLLATQMLSAVQERLHVKVALETLNTTQSLQEFSAAVEQMLTASDKHLLQAQADTKKLEHLDLTSWPLSPQQQRLWFFHELASDDPAYNLAQPIYFQGELDYDKLEPAINHVLSIHEAFNSVLNTEDNGVVATRLDSPVTCKLVAVDGASDEEQETALAEQIIEKNTQAKDFSQPSLEANLFVLAEDRALLVLFIPHLLTDGLSFNVFYEQVHKAYENLLSNKPVGTDISVPFQYSDYVSWRTESPANFTANTVEFWQSYLSGIPDLVQLPTSYARPRELSSRGSSLYFSLSEDQSERVELLCKALNTTPFVYFLSQLYLLLWKYSGQSSFVVGAPYANRTEKEMQSIVGFFVDMIPIRADIAGELTLKEWLDLVKQSFSRAMDNFDLGLDKIVEASGVTRHTNAHPLFQVTFTYLSYMNNTLGSDRYSMRQLLVNRGVSEYDLSLYMWNDDGFTGAFEFATELFSPDVIERLSDHFVSIIDWGLADHEQTLASLSLVGDQDLELIKSINSTEQASFLGQNVVDLFQAAVVEYPGKLAVRAVQGELTYLELDRASHALAAQLCERGVKTGEFVGVYTERGLNTLVALLAILKSGATYIPLDPGFPNDRLSYIVENSGVKCIFTDAANKDSELLSLSGIEVIELPDTPVISEAQGFELPARSHTSLAYVLYTSGSTGKPKGVPIQHDALANFLLHSAKQPGISDSDKLLAITTTSFDISFLELLLPVINGATVVIADSVAVKDGEALLGLVEREDISYLQATPVTWSLLLDSGWQGKPGLKMLSGGEALKPELAARLLSLGGELWNAYGPTECTIWSSYARIQSAEEEPHIGQPMANTRYFIIDENNQLSPPGVVGELGISGVALSPGYYKRDELTEQVFVDIQLPGDEPARVYKTGDLAQLTASGNFRCLGRKDFQVKIRGFRIELGEIESVLSSYEGVEESCCGVFEPSSAEKTLVAYYRSTSPIAAKELRDYLKQALPPYMVPGAFVHMETFPKTANQKIDRKSLPAPKSDSQPASINQSPKDDIEAALLDLYANNLGFDIALEENYFDAGGNSILALSLTREINRAFNSNRKVGSIFRYPTVLDMAGHLREANSQVSSLVIPLNRSASASELYFVCGIALYQPLAQLLSKHYSCFGVYVPEEDQFFDGQEDGSTLTIPSLARLYVEAIQKQNPAGPYTIAGVSFGGILAFEIARQLVESGFVVNDLIILDAVLPQALKRSWALTIRTIAYKLKTQGFSYIKARLTPEKYEPPQGAVNDQRNNHLWRAIRGRASKEYFQKVPDYEQKAIVIRASDRSEMGGHTLSHDLGWGSKLAGPTTYVTSEGGHLGILTSPKSADLILEYVTSSST